MSKKNLNPEKVINELRGESVFFRDVAVASPTEAMTTPLTTEKQVDTQAHNPTKAHSHEDTSVLMHARTNTPTHKRADEQLNKAPDVQLHERTNVHSYRVIARKTLDLYLDQIEQLDELVVRRRRELKRHVTIGEVAREIVDFFFQHNQ